MADQRCGTCRWASPGPFDCVECAAPLPASILRPNDAGRTIMEPHEGADCPCYQQTEDSTDADAEIDKEPTDG